MRRRTLGCIVCVVVGLGCGAHGSRELGSEPAPPTPATTQAATTPDTPPAPPPPSSPTTPRCAAESFTAYYGNGHAHTGYSDGANTPGEALVHARDVGKLDWMIVSDHLEQLYLPDPIDKFGNCRKQADAVNQAGRFVAACGYEYGTAITDHATTNGHINVFDTADLLPVFQPNFHDFYNSLASCKTCIGQFNHPDDAEDQHWNHFEYHPEVDEKMALFEFNSEGDPWTFYFMALDAGWHVSAEYNQDNHGANWGDRNDNRSGVWMKDLSRASLFEGMRAMRTFATTDKNATIRMMADDTCWMGSTIRGTGHVTLSVDVTDADASDGFDNIEIYMGGKKLVTHLDCGGATKCTKSYVVDTKSASYFVARATQKDGNWLVSAPIWIEP